MIPNAVASTGPYAGLWSHLKSIDYALERALNADSKGNLTELDKERLSALSELLRRGVSSTAAGAPPALDLLAFSHVGDPEYSSAYDFRDRIAEISAFKEWKEASRIAFVQKIQMLIDAIDNFVNKPSTSLFTKDAPRAEFMVLRAIVQSLLSDAEAALQ